MLSIKHVSVLAFKFGLTIGFLLIVLGLFQQNAWVPALTAHSTEHSRHLVQARNAAQLSQVFSTSNNITLTKRQEDFSW